MLSNLHRLQGALALGKGDSASAETYLQQAVAVAQKQGSKLWELRAATDLARLWLDQGKHQRAYDLLAPVYNGGTESFDTADQQDAKALLAELA